MQSVSKMVTANCLAQSWHKEGFHKQQWLFLLFIKKTKISYRWRIPSRLWLKKKQKQKTKQTHFSEIWADPQISNCFSIKCICSLPVDGFWNHLFLLSNKGHFVECFIICRNALAFAPKFCAQMLELAIPLSDNFQVKYYASGKWLCI